MLLLTLGYSALLFLLKIIFLPRGNKGKKDAPIIITMCSSFLALHLPQTLQIFWLRIIISSALVISNTFPGSNDDDNNGRRWKIKSCGEQWKPEEDDESVSNHLFVLILLNMPKMWVLFTRISWSFFKMMVIHLIYLCSKCPSYFLCGDKMNW